MLLRLTRKLQQQLIEYYYLQNDKKDFEEAVRATLRDIVGSYALVIVCADYPDRLICAKKDNPIVIGIGENENFVASDIPALIEYTVMSYLWKIIVF